MPRLDKLTQQISPSALPRDKFGKTQRHNSGNGGWRRAASSQTPERERKNLLGGWGRLCLKPAAQREASIPVPVLFSISWG
ncbi:hypothetical protein AOLI_G00148910 [Acnodon oligacanthus]